MRTQVIVRLFATETVDSGLIRGRVKLKTAKIVLFIVSKFDDTRH